MAYHSWVVEADTLEKLKEKIKELESKYHAVYGFHTVSKPYFNQETNKWKQTVGRYDCE